MNVTDDRQIADGRRQIANVNVSSRSLNIYRLCLQLRDVAIATNFGTTLAANGL